MNQQNLGGLDRAKLIAAFLVVAIHTSPLSSCSADADFILTRVAARLAVPFFLMVTGYFLLPQYLFAKSMDQRPLLRFLKKIALLYGAAILLYLPVNFYAGHFYGADAATILKRVLVDGTFYHLWYLPALLLGLVVVYAIGYRLPFSVTAAVCLGLYLVGLGGDSYYGLLQHTPIAGFYEQIFRISSYTRDGLFYVPIFLVLGARMAVRRPVSRTICAIGFAVSFLLMTGEGMTLHTLGGQRHDSMYFALIPCMFFLFPLLLGWDKSSSPWMRQISTWIYLLHPFMILIVRRGARILHLPFLIENSLAHYTAVCLASAAAAVLLNRFLHYFQKKNACKTGRAWIELDSANLCKNLETLRKRLPTGCELMPAVKANSYGHGAVLTAKVLQQQGVRAFCVACAAEGVELRKNGITGEILILGYTHPAQVPLLHRYRLSQTVVDALYAEQLDAAGKKLHVHIKVDTGMHRLGERPECLDAICRIFAKKHLVVDGIFTHLCVSDGATEADREYTGQQAAAFRQVLDALDYRGLDYHKAHLLASYGVLHYPDLAGEYARVGIAIYGLVSSRADADRCPVPLYPVLSLKARVSIVKNLYKGEGTGYGLCYTAPDDRRIAVLSIGYADGLPRSLSGGKGRVLIRGQAAPIIGNICMDQTLVDVTGIPDVQQGDVAVLIGRSGEMEISAYDLAEQAGTITNELLSRLGPRLERILC